MAPLHLRLRRRPPGAPRARPVADVSARRRAWMVNGLYLAAGLGAALFQIGLLPSFHELLEPGQRATQTIVATAPFEAVDLAQTELRRLARAEAVPPVFRVDPAPLAETRRLWTRLFARLDEAAEDEAAIADALDAAGAALSTESALRLAEAAGGGARAAEALHPLFERIWNEGIVHPGDRLSTAHPRIQIERDNGASTRIVDTAALRGPDAALAAMIAAAAQDPALATVDADALRALAGPRLLPNLSYQTVLTMERRGRAQADTPPAMLHIAPGATLIRKGEPASPQAAALLRAHREALLSDFEPRDRRLDFAGRTLLLLAGLGAILLILRALAPPGLHPARDAAFFLAATAGALAAVRLILLAAEPGGPVPPAMAHLLFPLAAAPLAAALLLPRAHAFLLGLWITLAASVISDASTAVAWIGLLSAAVAVSCARKVRRRAKILRAGLWCGAAAMATVIAQGVLYGQSAAVIGIQSAYTLAGGLGSAVAVLLLLPALETLFGLTSDIRLLELTDPSHPLLERLALEAPGTYHHSLMVAHLAQSAAQAIGANDLLVRVGALYHDIGKLAKPEYFIENQRPGENPHDELSPSMSRLIITSHVKEGVQLARRHRLPRPVLDAIEQHHGTSRVGYFFDRYLRRATDAGAAEAAARHEGEFRYPGPTPLSREMAVLALADTVEAAARSLERPSPARLRELVRALLLQKMRDGQLRSAALTMAEVEEVQNAFVFTLLSMSHGRIAYTDADAHGGAPAGDAPGADGGAADAGALPDAPGGAPESGAAVDGGGDRAAE